MAGDDKIEVIPGKLKFKGDKVKDGRVDKKKKKKHSSKDKAKSEEEIEKPQSKPTKSDNDQKDQPEDEEPGSATNIKKAKAEPAWMATKTEAEKRFLRMKRARLDQEVEREGYKTHKERVEDFNKRLAAQSEHHDMPKIGPG